MGKYFWIGVKFTTNAQASSLATKTKLCMLNGSSIFIEKGSECFNFLSARDGNRFANNVDPNCVAHNEPSHLIQILSGRSALFVLLFLNSEYSMAWMIFFKLLQTTIFSSALLKI